MQTQISLLLTFIQQIQNLINVQEAGLSHKAVRVSWKDFKLAKFCEEFRKQSRDVETTDFECFNTRNSTVDTRFKGVVFRIRYRLTIMGGSYRKF